MHAGGVGLGEDRADRRGDHVGVAPGHDRQDVAQEMDSAPLPCGSDEYGADGGLEAGVGVGDDQLDSPEAAGLQPTQERGPKRPVLAVADVHPEDLTTTIGADADRDDDRLRHDPLVHAGLAVGGVEEHVRVRGVLQRPVPERGDLSVEVLADPAHLGLGDPGVRAQGLDQVIDLAGGHPVQVGLHHHGEQGLIDPPALQQGREERPRAQLRDPQFQLARHGRQGPGPGAVTDRRAGLGAFPEARADHALSLRVDQRLIHVLRRQPDPVVNTGRLQRLQQVEQGRMVDSHRARCPLGTFVSPNSLTLARWPSTKPTTTPTSSPKTHHHRQCEDRWCWSGRFAQPLPAALLAWSPFAAGRIGSRPTGMA